MIHTISIATADDIIHIGHEVNIYPVYLSPATSIWGNFLNWLKKTIVSRFGNSPRATECIFVQKLISLLLNQNICSEYSKEQSQ